MTIRHTHLLIAAIGLALLPLMVRAQPVKTVPRIGYLSARVGADEISQSVVERLRELGYAEGQNLIIEWR